MTSLLTYVAFISGLALVGLAILALNGKKRKPDFFTLFTLGLIFTPIGLVLDNPAFWIVGVVFFIVGLVNKRRWAENHRDWEGMSDKEQKWIITIFFFLTIAVLALLGIALL